MRKYEEYKHSGINWLGEVPSHWQIARAKDISNISRGAILRPVDEPSYFDTNGEWYYLNISDVKKGEKLLSKAKLKLSKLGSTKSARVSPGNLIITASATIGIPFINTVPVCVHDGFIPFKKNKIDVNFMFYYLSNSDIYTALGKNNTQKNIYLDEAKNITFTFPKEKDVQQAIAHYLDAKTQAIDKKVSLLEQKIETYKKLKRTLINQTITKGLDKNVLLKNSGISLIGQIPQHWEVKRLKELGNIETSSINKKIEEDEDLIKLVNYTDVYSNLKREIWNNDDYMIVSANKLQISSKKLKQGDVLFTPSSETINDIGVSAVVMENLHNTLYSYHLLRLRFRKVIDLHFKKYLFSNDYVQYYFSKSATGTTRKILGLNTFNNLEVPLPPKSEQEEIATYLDHKTATIDAIVSNIGKQIDTLKQLRKTLINDVVTGKIKVIE